MKRLGLIYILVAFIFVWSGCSKGIVTDSSALPVEDDATEITIEVYDITDFYANAALKFEEETGIKVNFINNHSYTSSSATRVATRVATRERIQAELMAGKGVDIYANIYLNFVGIGENNNLCNLADWMESDPYFTDDKYYMNILESGFDEGNVYSFPLFMVFSALGSTVEVPELDGQSLDWEEFFTLTKDIKRSGVLYGITDYILFRQRFKDRYDSFIDEENKTQNLNSPEMIAFLKQCKEWSSENLCIPYSTENFSQMFENAFFIEYGGNDMYVLTNFRFDNPFLEDEPYLYDIPSDSIEKDKVNRISPRYSICINAASQYKGTAWKFIKFLLREDIQVTGLCTPVNRTAAEEHTSKSLNETVEFFGLDIDPNQVIKESEAILNAADGVSNNIYSNDIEGIVVKEAKRYFINEISADEAARNMAATMDLYFKEQ